MSLGKKLILFGVLALVGSSIIQGALAEIPTGPCHGGRRAPAGGLTRRRASRPQACARRTKTSSTWSEKTRRRAWTRSWMRSAPRRRRSSSRAARPRTRSPTCRPATRMSSSPPSSPSSRTTVRLGAPAGTLAPLRRAAPRHASQSHFLILPRLPFQSWPEARSSTLSSASSTTPLATCSSTPWPAR